MGRKQQTLGTTARLAGVGLHTGAAVEITLSPADSGKGVVFVRTDLPEQPRIPLDLRRVANAGRRTTIRKGDAEVHTVEHLLASLYGLQVDNVEVAVTGEELPGMDGSALPFVKAIRDAGIVAQAADRPSWTPDREIGVDLPGEDVTLVAMPAEGGLHVTYTLDYKTPEIPLQRFSAVLTPEVFEREIAPARTFCLEKEARALRDAGLGLGANTSNTLVVSTDGKPLENTLRFPDEYVRHKVLDLIGDLSLFGMDLSARVMALRSGHDANVSLVRRLREGFDRQKKDRAAHENFLDVREVMRILPHRYPFLLIDRVIELDGYRRAVGIKNVSINEPFFQGHWPGQPVMPGVLIVEAMAQLSGVLLLRKLEHTGKLAVLLSIDRVKLRRAVVPGDQLQIEAIAENVKARTGRVLCRATVEGKLASQARIKFMLVDAD